MKKKEKKAAIGFIFLTLVIDITGWGIIIPVIPKLIQELINGDLSDASKIGGWLLFAYAFTQFLLSPLIGNLSDKYGRRPIILFSLLGFSLDYLFLAFAPTITFLFIGRIIAGITGASITTATAYIADISTPENRAKNFGMIGAAFGIGFIIGPVIGGLLGQFGARVPFYAAAALCFINFLYGYFVLPESLPKENRRDLDWSKTNPIRAILNLKKYPKIFGLFISIMLVYIGSHAVHSNWSYFTMYQFKWDEKMVGISLGIIGLLVGIVQGGLIRYINPKIGNEKSIIYGLVLYTLGMFLFAIATESWMMFTFLIPYCLGGISGPALQSVITENVPANEQGEIQGTLTSLMSLTAIIGPPLMSNVFYNFTNKNAVVNFPGAPFVLGGILMLFSAIIAFYSFKKQRLIATAAITGTTTDTFAVLSNLSPNTTYYFWVKSICGNTQTNWVSGDSFTTYSATGCNAPTQLYYDGLTSTTNNIAWVAPTPAPSNGYVYCYSTINDPFSTGAITGTTTDTFAVLNNLSPNTTYYFWVKSICGNTQTNWVSGDSFTTYSATGCNAPTQLYYDGLTSTTNNIAWVAPTPAPSNGYVYCYSTINDPFSTGAITGTTSDTFAVLSNLSPNTTYYFWVKSICGNTQTNWVSGGSFTTQVLTVESFSLDKVKLYPNPVKTIFNISLDKEITTISIFNILGQEVLSKSVNSNETSIDVNDLTAGTYLVKVTSNNEVKTLKVIKQ